MALRAKINDGSRYTIVSLIFTLMTFQSLALAGIGNVTGVAWEGKRLILTCGHDVVVFQLCTEHVLMINYRLQGIEDPDTLVVANTHWPLCSATFDTSGDPITIQGTQFRIEINRTPMRFHGYDASGACLFEEPPDEGLYDNGLKLKIPPGNFYSIFNKPRGSTLTNNTGGLISAGSQGGAGAPFVWTPKGWGILADTDGGLINISADSLVFSRPYSPNKRDVEVYFIFGNPKEIINGMTDISGKPPLFPKFTLGFLNTEWGMDESELRRDVQTYRDKGIPLDAYILDFDWMDWGSDNYGEFRWGPKFPTGPTGQLKTDLDSLGVKLLGIRKPRIHLDTQQGNYCQSQGFFVDSTTDYFSGKRVGRLNFHLPAVRQWFWDSFIRQGDSYNKGIIGYWNDEADEYGGNLMFLQMQRSQYEGQRQYNNRRVWSINRNFYLGAQRYAYAHWSGDIDTGFSSMADQRLFLLSSIVLGSSWWGMDIGGFQDTPSPENYFRWIQFGAFVPVFRVHGTYGQEREPWHYGPEAEAIATKYIRLRYQLLPYIYSAAWQNHKTGLSIVRPLVLEYPDDDNVANNISEWLFGDDLLVHPVVAPGAATVSIYLPKGKWLDYWTGRCYVGPANVLYEVTREDIPIFVKAGAVIPTAPAGRFVDDPETQSLLMLNCYPGAEGWCLLYEDDGLTYNYETGSYCVTPISHCQDETWAKLRIESRQGSFAPPQRDFLTQFYFLDTRPDSVLWDDISLEVTSADTLRSTSTVGWAYEPKNRSCLVRFPDDGAAHQVQVALARDLVPPAIDTVFVKADTIIWVQFTERVCVGQGEVSVENISHYTISGGVTVCKAIANPPQDAVTLITTPHQPEVVYTIMVSGIADRSAARNIMTPAQYSYRYSIIN